jgi:hypothetical protein
MLDEVDAGITLSWIRIRRPCLCRHCGQACSVVFGDSTFQQLTDAHLRRSRDRSMRWCSRTTSAWSASGRQCFATKCNSSAGRVANWRLQPGKQHCCLRMQSLLQGVIVGPGSVLLKAESSSSEHEHSSLTLILSLVSALTLAAWRVAEPGAPSGLSVLRWAVSRCGTSLEFPTERSSTDSESADPVPPARLASESEPETMESA